MHRATPSGAWTPLLRTAIALAVIAGCSDEPAESEFGWPGLDPSALRRQADPPLPLFDAKRWAGKKGKAKCAADCVAGGCAPTGKCCPTGQAWSDIEGGCAAVGPVGCLATTQSSAAACVPRWCQRWTDGAGKPCQAGAADCSPSGRACGAADDAASRCAAGSIRSPGGTCVLAGSQIEVPVGHELVWQQKDPPQLVAAKGPAALLALPAAAAPRWCPGPDGSAPTPCVGAGLGCAAGETLVSGVCVAAGSQVKACPPGFVADATGTPADGVPGCAAIAADCGAAPFGAIKPGKAIYFVDANAPAGGDGSIDKPLRTLVEGLAAAAKAPAPPTVVLAAGAYDGAIELDKSVVLRGRCAAKVSIVGTPGVAVLKASTNGLKVTLRDLRLVGGDEGLRADDGAKVTLSRVQISLAAVAALRIGGPTQVTADSLVIEGGAMVGQAGGRGIRIDDGATLGLNGARITGCRDRGLYAMDPGTAVVAKGLYVDQTGADVGDQGNGRGIDVRDGARLALTGGLLQGNRTTGIYLHGAASGSRLEDLRVANTEATLSDGGHGEGIVIRDCPAIELVGIDLQANRNVGLAIEGTLTQADVQNLRVRDTRSRAGDGGKGVGVAVRGAASATLKWLHLVKNRRSGLSAADQAVVKLQLGLVAATLAEEVGGGGMGLDLSSGSKAELSDVRLSGNRDVGLRLDDPGTVVHATNLIVDSTEPRQSDLSSGRGVAVRSGANLTLKASRLSANRDVGLLVAGAGSWAVLEDVLVDGTLARASDGRYGRGIAVFEDASLSLTQGRCSGNHNVGLIVDGVGSKATINRLIVDGTKGNTAERPEGYGVAVTDGAWLTLSDAGLHGNEGAGLYVYGTATDATVIDLIAAGTLPMSSNEGGFGVAVGKGGALQLRRARLSANQGAGMWADGAMARVKATDLLVDGTRAAATTGPGGRGVALDNGAVLRLRRAWLVDNREVGLHARDAGTRVDASDVWIAATGPRPAGGFGHGAVAEDAAELVLAGARIQGQHGSGIAIMAAQGTLDGVLVEAGPTPKPYALVAGIAGLDHSVLVLRSSKIVQPFQTGLAGARSHLRISEVVIDGAAYVGQTPASGDRWDHQADGIATFEGILEVSRSLVVESARAGLLLTGADETLIGRSAFFGGYYGVVTASGLPPLLDATLIDGQSGAVGAVSLQLNANLGAEEPGKLAGVSSP